MRIFLLAEDQLLTNAFKTNFEELYSLPSLEDMSFRLPDFGPDLIVLNDDLWSLENLKLVQEVSSDIPVVVLGNMSNEENLGVHFLAKPLPFESLKTVFEDLFKKLS